MGTCEMAQWVEALAAKCGNLNSTPGALVVVGELTPMCAHKVNSSCRKRE